MSCRSRFTVILNSTCWISTHSYVPSIPWADNGVIFSTILTYACMAMVTPEVRAQIFVECVKWPFCRLTVSCRPTVEVTASPARKVRSIAGTSNRSVPWSLCVRITYEWNYQTWTNQCQTNQKTAYGIENLHFSRPKRKSIVIIPSVDHHIKKETASITSLAVRVHPPISLSIWLSCVFVNQASLGEGCQADPPA